VCAAARNLRPLQGSPSRPGTVDSRYIHVRIKNGDVWPFSRDAAGEISTEI
jgi:hypothetical protein